jgi:hypothetical protein
VEKTCHSNWTQHFPTTHHVGVRSVPLTGYIEERRTYLNISFSLDVCVSQVTFVILLSSLSHHSGYMHNRLEERASETPSIKILHREMGDKVFGSVLAHLLTCAQLLPCRPSAFSMGSATLTPTWRTTVTLLLSLSFHRTLCFSHLSICTILSI